MNIAKSINRKHILVTSAHLGSSVTIIRSLSRAGYWVAAADSDPACLGFCSRFVNTKVVYPNPESHSQLFVEFLLKVIKKEKIDLLIPTTDYDIYPILANRELFDSVVMVALPENYLLDIVNDKIKTIQLAEKLNVPVPKTYVAKDSTEVANLEGKLSWPIVVKPQFSKKLTNGKKIESFQITYANSSDDLQRTMKVLENKCSVILQEYHSGIGYGIEMLTHKGAPVAAFAHKRLREIPITGGASSYRQSIKLDDKLFFYALKILKELRWNGLAMIEFKANESEAFLMEINGRVWGSLPLAVASGVNFPVLLANLFLSNNGEIKTSFPNDYKVGVRCRNLIPDLMWIVSVLMQHRKYPFLPIPKRPQAVKAILSFFNPFDKFDLFCFDDPMPGLAEFPLIPKKFREKFRKQNKSILPAGSCRVSDRLRR